MELHDTPNIITIEHKLLENIQNLLIEQNKLIKGLQQKQPMQIVESITQSDAKRYKDRGGK